MLNYGIFGFRESTALFGRALESMGCPIVAIGEGERPQSEMITVRPKPVSLKGPSRFFINTESSQASSREWTISRCIDPHREWLSPKLHGSTVEKTLWDIVRKDSVGAVILGEESPFASLRACFQSRNDQVGNGTGATDGKIKIVAVDTSALATGDTHDLKDMIALLEDDVAQAKKSAPRYPIILPRPALLTKVDPVLSYAAAVAPKAVGHLKEISISYQSAESLARWRERKKVPYGPWVRVANLLHHMIKAEEIAESTASPKHLNELSSNANFVTKFGVKGTIAIQPESKAEELSFTIVGDIGTMVCSKNDGALSPIYVRIVPHQSGTALDPLSRTFRALLPNHYPKRRTAVDCRWAGAVTTFLKRLAPREVIIEELLQESLTELIELKNSIHLANQLFVVN